MEIKGPNLVKGINLEGLRIIGKPDFFSKLYYEENIDEIFFQDTVASLYGRNNLKNIISQVSKNIFVPLIVGGGLKSIKDIKIVLESGADKVCINSEAIKNIDFIKTSVKEFGSSTITAEIQIQKKNDGKYYCFYENGRQETNLDPITWACTLQDNGVGEIALTFVNFDGTGKGFDLTFVSQLRNKLNIPLIVSGGIGNKEQVLKAFQLDIDGVLIASAFHYFYLYNNYENIKKEIFSEGNLEFLKNLDKKILENTFSIDTLKKFLKTNNINCAQ